MAFTTSSDIVIEADTVLTSENLQSVGGAPITLGQKTMANSLPVVIASDQSTISVTGTVSSSTSSSATRTDIARSNVNQTFLSANASRKGATIYNDSIVNLFIKFGATASTSDFIVRLSSQDYYEIPFNYIGRIDGIWPSNGAGSARITELI